MPTVLTPERHLAGLREALVAFRRYADRAGPDAPVPTCPGWTVRDLEDDVAVVRRTFDAVADRDGWARRTCHALTLRAVDALAATLGRAPQASELWLDPDLAVDGIDELLGWWRLRCEDDALLVVRLDDRHDWWGVELGAGPPRATHHAGGAPPEADWELTGTAVELYLRLWDRAPARRLVSVPGARLGPPMSPMSPAAPTGLTCADTPSREATP